MSRTSSSIMSTESMTPEQWDARLRDLTQVVEVGPLTFESCSDVCILFNIRLRTNLQLVGPSLVVSLLRRRWMLRTELFRRALNNM